MLTLTRIYLLYNQSIFTLKWPKMVWFVGKSTLNPDLLYNRILLYFLTLFIVLIYLQSKHCGDKFVTMHKVYFLQPLHFQDQIMMP